MKKVSKVLMLPLCFILLLTLYGCGKNRGTNIEIKDAEKIGDDVYMIKVPSTMLKFSFSDYITVNKNSIWTVSTDWEGIDVIESKTVLTTEEGEFYSINVKNEKTDQIREYTVFLKRKEVYTISFDTNGGSKIESIHAEEDSKIEIPSETPVKEGYTFVGWNYNFDKNITKDIRIDALWNENTYTVSLDANGGKVLYDSINVKYNNSYELPIPTKKGYTFVGWYKNNTKVISSVWTYAENVKLQAKWEKRLYTIKYELNGGTFETSYPTGYYYGEEKNIPIPVKEGYEFIGWESNIVTDVKYFFITSEYYTDITLSACWKKI